MGDILLWGVQAVVAWFEVWLCYQFLFVIVLDDECLDRKEKIVEWGNILAVGLFLAANRRILFFSRIAFVICVVMTGICFIWMSRQEILLDIGLVILYFSLISLLDFLLAFISMVFLQQQFQHKVFFVTTFWQIVIFIISRFIVFACVYMMRRKVFEIDVQEYKYIFILWSVVLAGVLRYYQNILSDMAIGAVKMKGGTTGFSLFVLVILILFAGVVLLKNRSIQKENEFLMSRDEMIEQKYQEMSKLVEKNRELVHDVNNHIVILSGYAQAHECERIIEYLGELGQHLFKGNVGVWTGNITLDMLLSQKKGISEQMGVRFDVESIYRPCLPFSDNHICSLFGNLLDNALEACERMNSGNCWILLKIERQNQMLFIELSNSIEKKPRMDKGKWVSDKTDKGLHGYGQKSVRRIVEEYGGIITYQAEDNVFRAALSFFDMDNIS